MRSSSPVETKEITVPGSAATVAQPSAGTRDDSAGGPPTILMFSLAFREGPGGPLTWSTELPVVQMLADLVAASSAIAEEDSEGVLTAVVPGSIEAVVLAVRARKLAEAYSRHAGDDLRGIAIGILSQPGKGVSQEAAQRTLRSYLESHTNSWQVLLTGEAYKLLNSTPGLLFRKLSAPSGPRLDMHELVLPPVNQAPSPTTTVEIPVVAAVQPVTAAEPVLVQHEDREVASGGNLKLILGGVAAVVVVAALFIFKPWASHAPPAPAPAVVATPAVTAPPAAVETAAPAPAKPAALERVEKQAAAKPAAPAPSAKATRAGAPEAAAQPTHGGGGYTAEQLQAILDKADALTSNGKYDDAIRNYNVVLASDPGNARARAGKERALANKNLK